MPTEDECEQTITGLQGKEILPGQPNASFQQKDKLIATKRKLSPLSKSSNNPSKRRTQLESLYANTNMSKSNFLRNTPTGLSTSNRFAPLAQTNKKNATSNKQSVSAPSKPLIPPIVIMDMNIDDIHQIMQNNKIEKNKYFVKFMSIGTKIMLLDIQDFQTVKLFLTTSGKPFFTHDVAEDKTQKFVISGLHDMDLSEIKQQLSEVNINCLDVKRMKTKSAENPLYLVYFADKSIKLDSLKKTKAIGNVIIKWSNYITSRNGPTQCNRCQLYGHGSRNCHLPPRCLLCAGKHQKSDCPLAQSDSFIPKCCLCDGDHTSNAVHCPNRQSYIEMRAATSRRSSKFQRHTNNTNQPTLPLHSQPFSNQSIKNQSETWSSLFQNKPSTSTSSAPPPNTMPKSDPPPPLLRLHRQPAAQTQIISSSSHNSKPTNELFSMDELLEISNTLILELAQCRTKIEQFQVLSKLSIRFVYGLSNGL